MYRLFGFLAALLFWGAGAQAQTFKNSTFTFSNNASIAVPGSGTSGPASPYPSNIIVSGVTDPITDVNVTLKGINHSLSDDLDILLVSPLGEKVLLMSDAGGNFALNGVTLTFDDEGGNSLPDDAPIGGGNFQPINYQNGDIFDAPAPAEPYSPFFTAFDGTNANGTWSLYIVDDQTGNTGQITEGWSLNINTSPVITIPGSGALGPASPYPSVIEVSGITGNIIDVNVTLDTIAHTFPSDMDILLVGPQGQNVVLLSDAGSNFDLTGTTLVFDDEAAGLAPGTERILGGSYQPTNYGTSDPFNAPAPAGPYGSALSVFDGINANGTWSLYVMDDGSGDSGQILKGWSLTIDTLQTGSEFIVNNIEGDNDGICGVADCSLREAITAANANADESAITFAPNSMGIINLSGTTPALNANVTIQGPGASVLTVQRSTGGNYRIFTVNAGITASVSGLTISNGNSGNGGGITNVGTLAVTESVFSGNTPTNGGGIYNTGALTVNNSTFSNNTLSGNGGGIYNQGTATVTNCTFSANSASSGGGIANEAGTLLLTNCTFNDNTVTTAGKSLYNVGTASTQVGNSIFNGAGFFSHIAVPGGSFLSLGYNLSSDAASGDGGTGPGGLLDKTGDIRNTDPLLGGLTNNGGQTPTHAVADNSPAINAGDPNFTPPPTTDQRGDGYPRVQGGRIDIGAYEATALSINNVSINEGASGTSTLDFTVTLSSASTQVVVLHYETQDGTAVQPTDYDTASGTLIFNPGELSKTVSVTIQDDTTDENNETFKVVLSAASNAVIVKDQGIGTIVDDDAAPTLSINNINVTESNGGSVQAQFTIAISKVSGRNISVVAQSSTNAGSPTATPGTDYVALPPTTINIAPGLLTKTVSVTILGDLVDENNEKFAVNLSGAVNATISDNAGIGTIIDNDAAPTISAIAPNVTEGNSGTTAMTFTLSLSAASARNISVQYRTANAATFPATAGADYVAVPLTTVIFTPGQTTKTVTVTVNGDLLDEDNERIALSLANPVNATLGTVTDGIIVDDDAAPSLSINDVTVTEGNSGTAQAVFTITLSAPSARSVTVNAATGNGGTPSAIVDIDYQELFSTPITFAPGQTTKQVSITIYGDTVVEANEKFGVILSGAVNATITDNSGIGTITNDDTVQAPAPSS